MFDYIFYNPSLHTGVENLFAVYGYAMVIYCDFSGYSDVAIGIALWLGFKIPPNFLSPYQSKNITEFLRRLHISLSSISLFLLFLSDCFFSFHVQEFTFLHLLLVLIYMLLYYLLILLT